MAESAAAAVARQLPKGFKLGQKQVFLPNHVITFLRKDHLPPNEACFQVPLTFTKFDLRDYLFNLYNVEVTKVRSYVKQQPLTQRYSNSRSWYRPLATKIMTVELEQPFQWPEVPKNLEAWNKDLWDQREALHQERTDQQLKAQKHHLPMKGLTKRSEERKELNKLANQVLSGEVKWENNAPLDPKWDSIVNEVKRTEEQSKTTSTQ
ncbi:hypothetical protein VHEMI04579 [[Torrubiella] hemipterigena]|uniref:Large ribosomal subunit protein uL23m n=1 Tax=[Torrubiella] hemipterigena TaxID=1531966 RepID=A0A0A1TGQ6_9HYPO|nr:hypothetical protein VHEMI04579 [[Torrubiella] hemipterigena]